MDQFFSWLSNNPVATYVLIISFAVLVVFFVWTFGKAFYEGRSISFWPPKIGEKVTISNDDSHPSTKSKVASVYSYFDEPLLISSDQKNMCKIYSDFILWEKCTFMLWILVPPKGEGLRNAPSNRYILSHYTSQASEEDQTYYNQFCFRYTLSDKWQVTFSNNKVEYPSKTPQVLDGLTPGWHHFLVAWDRAVPKIILQIDGGKHGRDISTSSFTSWPEKLADSATIGAWVTNWAGHYCETKLFSLKIFDEFFESTDSVVKEHLKLKPNRYVIGE